MSAAVREPLASPVAVAKEVPLQRINTYDFYQLGNALKPLASISAESTLGGVWWPLFTASQQINQLLSNPILRLVYCRPAAITLMNAVDGALAPIFEKDRTSPIDFNVKIEAGQAYSITHALSIFENNLAAELQQQDTYCVSKKGIYSTNDLIERAQQALPGDVLVRLPAGAAQDFDQAGKCLAFEVSTASGFHMLRATEAVIHKYYVAVTKNDDLKRKDRNWGAYVRNLNRYRKINPDSADPKIISMIDQIREHHRNVIIHPENTLTDSEAQVLFTVCVGAIIAMLRAIP
jgi:hypothetical protein